MNTDALNQLREFESQLDAEVANLAIWRLPVRCVLLAMHYSLYGFFTTDREKATTIAARMSHLIPMLAKCPPEPIGENAANALRAYVDTDPTLQQLLLAINYGHFSEVMPQVHRNYYTVTAMGEKHFRLEHRTENSAAMEVRDIVLSELAMPHITSPSPDVSEAIEQLTRTVPQANISLVGQVLGSYIDHYLKNVKEPELLSDAVLVDAFGADTQAINRFTSTLLAVAALAVDLSRALEARVRAEGTPKDLEAEWLEWVSIFWTADYVRHILRGTTGVSDEALTRLFSIFALDFRKKPARTELGGDGYFPPLAFLVGGGLLIGPYFTWLFTHTRNMLYALLKTDQQKFDNVVSGGLEPQLLIHVESMFRRLPGIEIKANVAWDAREIDLLVFEPATNTALHIQAKAPIAPYGARMIARLESRIQEGIEQVQSFRALPQERVDTVISEAFGREVSGVKVIDAILARSCFGTYRTWDNAADISFLSLAVLAELTREGPMRLQTLAELPARAQEYLEETIAKASPVWTHKPLILGEYVIDLPMLDLDQRFLDGERRKVWS